MTWSGWPAPVGIYTPSGRMAELPVIVEERPRGIGARAHAWFRGRRFLLAACLALAEVIAYLVLRPGAVLSVVAAALVMAVALGLALRRRPGALRDLLLVLGLAQTFVVVVPVVIGLSLAIGVLLALVILIALVVVAVRVRV
jgi:hypothetical protein